MSPHDPLPYEPRLYTRDSSGVEPGLPVRRRRSWLLRSLLWFVLLLAVAGVCGFYFAQHWVRQSVAQSLPQIDGNLVIAGLAAPVTVRRDVHGMPHLRAESLDDLVFAQGFVTAQDRLFQMDTLRRHAAGELAAILGASLVPHDKLQRYLQLRATAERAVEKLPADQQHLLEQYAAGVNASIEQQAAHLPIEFKVLQYKPDPWTPRDSILVSLAMFEDLTDSHGAKLTREALDAELPAELTQDLYPTGSWRDHPPSAPPPDLTVPGPPITQVPLDESQSRLRLPQPSLPLPTPASLAARFATGDSTGSDALRAGSNNWAVSGAHTASGKPLLSNDMHLNATLPGIWYESDLSTPIAGGEDLHVTGVTIPGLPLIVVGHNAHVAWGFTNLGADVQDVYIENTRGTGSGMEFEAVDGTWQPVVHLPEVIQVKHAAATSIDVLATRHGDSLTPILTPLLKGETRQLALRWTIYDAASLQLPVGALALAHDWTSFLAAMAQYGGPSQNVVYADDQGHIGYHAVGRVPTRGGANRSASTNVPSDVASPVDQRIPTLSPTIAANPDPLSTTAIEAPPAPNAALLSSALSPVPVKPITANEWSGYIPFDQMPQVFDPPGGIIATANARVTPDDYKYPITTNWAAPYRNERIWHLLVGRNGLTAADMLAIENDVYSDFDHVLAQRLAYALDHSSALNGTSYKPEQAKRLHLVADLLRGFNGRMTTESPAAAIVASTHALLWPMLLAPHRPAGADNTHGYAWYSKDYALEQVLMHTPPRWLPRGFANWDDFLVAAVARALEEGHAPDDPAAWHYGSFHTFAVEHPIFAQSKALRTLYGKPTGTAELPLSGDATTVKQVGHSFGPSERFTVDFGNLDHSTLNLVLGQSGNPDSPWFLDQFEAWYHGTTYALPFSDAAVDGAMVHTLTLSPR